MDNNKDIIENKTEDEIKYKIEGEIEVKIEDGSKDKIEEKIVKLICACVITVLMLLCAVTIFIGIVRCKCKMPNMVFIVLIKCIALILIAAIICLTIIVGAHLKNKEKLKEQEKQNKTSEALRKTCEKMINRCVYCSYSGNAQCKKKKSSEKTE